MPLSLQTVLSFVGVTVLLGLAPGPDNVFVLTQALTHGARAALWVVLGLCTGLLVHTLLVSLGLAALLLATPWAMQLVQVLGALYLMRLAWAAWQSGAPTRPTAQPQSLSALWRRGVFMNLSNPKVALFFLALLPQFVDASQAAMPQLLALGSLFNLTTLFLFGAVAVFAGRLGRFWRERPGVQRVLNRVSAVVLLGLALRLLWA